MRDTQMELQLDVSENTDTKNLNPMVKTYGRSEDLNAKCKTCQHLLKKQYAGTYFKCELFGNTNGAGTDIRLKWDACRKYLPSPSKENK